MEITELQNNTSRREFVRIPATCGVCARKILFSAKMDTEVWGEVKNIGAGGICFVSEKKCSKDDMLKVTISIAGWKKHHPQFLRVYEDDVTAPMTAVCQVLRSKNIEDNKCEVAAKFVNIYEDDFVGLKQFIEHEAERLGVTV